MVAAACLPAVAAGSDARLLTASGEPATGGLLMLPATATGSDVRLLAASREPATSGDDVDVAVVQVFNTGSGELQWPGTRAHTYTYKNTHNIHEHARTHACYTCSYVHDVH